METILVLPLLLLVFGGMLMVGDILHGRLHLLTVDRVAAWSPDSRFEVGNTNIFTRWFRHVDRHTYLELHNVFANSYEGRTRHSILDSIWDGLGVGSLGMGSSRKTSPVDTDWLDYFGGRANASVEIPGWVAGMANTPAILWQRSAPLSATWRLMTYERDVDERSADNACHAAGDYQEFNRQYLVRRKSDGYVDKYLRRTNDAVDIDWVDVVLGSWPCDGGHTGGASILGKYEANLRRPFRRQPVARALAE